jgi:uncharacterized protein YaaQ
MKMIIAIVQADDASRIMEALVDAGHRATRIATTGAWLRRENVTLLLGAEDERVEEVLQVLQRTGQHRSAPASAWQEITGALNPQTTNVEVGGATIFVLNVEEFEHY